MYEQQQQTTERLPDRLVPINERPRLDEPPRIFVASTLDYRAGYLHGRWIGLARPLEDVQADIDAMLTRSPVAASRGVTTSRWMTLAAEGFGAADHDVDETLGLTRLTEWARSIAEHAQAFAAWARLDEGNSWHHAQFPDAYLGRYDNLLEYVVLQLDAGQYERRIESVVPANLRPYVQIDAELLAHDIGESGEVRQIAAPNGGIFLFKGTLDETTREGSNNAL